MKVGFRLAALALLGFFLSANAPAFPAAPPSTYRIAGTVVDSVTGQPLDDAEVTITSVTTPHELESFLTSADGRFLFTDLLAGKYRLMASRRGYARQAFHEHEAFSTAIVVGPGLDSEHTRFPLAPSSVITGVVTDEWGDAVRDAQVLLFQQSMSDGSRTLRNVTQTMTDDQGRYRFAHLLSGTYAVAIYTRPWYTQAQGQYDVFTSEHPLTISGDIVLSSGDVVVDNASQPSSVTQSQLSDVVYPVTFFPGVTTLAEAGRLAVAPGATETADFQLRAVPSVHLRVRVPASTPITIMTAMQDDRQQQEDGRQAANQKESSTDLAQVDAAPDISLTLKIAEGYSDQLDPVRKEIAPGLMELSGVPPGDINVAAASAQGSILDPQGIAYASRRKTLNVSGDTEVDFGSQGGSAKVSGVVLSSRFHLASLNTEQPPGDQPSTGRAAILRAIQEAQEARFNTTLTFRSLKAGDSYDATVSPEGKFSFPGSTLLAGSYELEFSPQSGLRVSSLEASGATVSGRTIEIPVGQPVKIVVHAAEANCSLSGFAIKNGKPVAGAMVLLVPQDPGHDMTLYHRDQSDSDASFTLPSIFPGRYILIAIENGWDLEWADPQIMFQYLPAGQPIELKPGASLALNAKVQ